ncbi:hypothetical protein J6590_104466, partial [Homalodisca vitripennis]
IKSRLLELELESSLLSQSRLSQSVLPAYKRAHVADARVVSLHIHVDSPHLNFICLLPAHFENLSRFRSSHHWFV